MGVPTNPKIKTQSIAETLLLNLHTSYVSPQWYWFISVCHPVWGFGELTQRLLSGTTFFLLSEPHQVVVGSSCLPVFQNQSMATLVIRDTALVIGSSCLICGCVCVDTTENRSAPWSCFGIHKIITEW